MLRQLFAGGLLLVTAGCSVINPPEAIDPSSRLCSLVLLSSYSGATLVATSGELDVRRSDGKIVHASWPPGYAATTGSSGVELRDQTGKVIARSGDHVDLSGDESTDGSTINVCALRVVPAASPAL
jgi:hypothetical protein